MTHKNWDTFAENPEAIRSLYEIVPSLQRLDLMSMHLSREGPSVLLDFNTDQFPKSPPKRWHVEFNSVVIRLSFWDITNFRAYGWHANMKVTADVFPNATGGLRVRILSGSDLKVLVSFNCRFFRIDKVSPYKDTHSDK